jgi:hypothetical protein
VQPFVLHTHFYQPERANPWTQALDPEPGAAPFRDWNERIHLECYRANAFARVYDGDGRVERIVNNYEHVSFNFGPTLLAWLERHHPETYGRILEADRDAVARTGHGNALAQAFHHTILPLDSERNRRTQIRWGIADFAHRFGRRPEGMWLPEAAANQAVVDALIDEGVRFTVLAPRQAARVREAGGDWRQAHGNPDPSRPHAVSHSDGSGRSIAVFFYDGGLAQRLAFDPHAMESAVMVDALASAAHGGLVHAAMDGETFGHHHRFAELGLAYTLTEAGPQRGFEPVSYGTYLEAYPPVAEAELVGGEGSSWSCAHGVGRWYRDCGCSTDAQAGWNQAWRAPLRAALDLVRDAADQAFADRGGELFTDPWAARDAYVDVVVGACRRDEFLAAHARRGVARDRAADAWTLLEAQRNAMAMYTSCGWFFADVSGIETVYVMRFAARTLELLESAESASPRKEVLERLGEARSNRPHVGTGADVWRDKVEPSAVPARRVAVQVALQSAAGHPAGADGHDVAVDFAHYRSGDTSLVAGTVTVRSRATTRTEAFTAAGLALGGWDLHAYIAAPDEQADRALDELGTHLPRTATSYVFSTLHELLGEAATLDDALPSGRAALVAALRDETVRRLRRDIASTHRRYERELNLLHAAGAVPPPELRMVEQVAVANRVERLLQGLADYPQQVSDHLDLLRRARETGDDAQFARFRHMLGDVTTAAVLAAVATPAQEAVDTAERLLEAAGELGIDLELRAAQEAVYDLAVRTRDQPRTGTDTAIVGRLGDLLGLSSKVWRPGDSDG